MEYLFSALVILQSVCLSYGYYVVSKQLKALQAQLSATTTVIPFKESVARPGILALRQRMLHRGLLKPQVSS